MFFTKITSMKPENSTSTNVVDINLSQSEKELIIEILKREPNSLELEIFSRLWSEHASYKNSLKWLQKLPRGGENVVVKAGDESAGAVKIGEDYVCVLKIESHNHPCSIQPRLGAYAGLSVVNRDVISMGAKPVAYMNALRFGEDNRDTARWLSSEVFKGIKDFEKQMRVPVVGGELFFDQGYNSSPVINNMTVGVVKKDHILSGSASGKNHVIVIVGALTGKEGVDSDAFVADFISEKRHSDFSYQQLVDSKVEKSLSDAVKVLSNKRLVDGIESVGSGGIVGTISEMAARGKSAVNLWCHKIPVLDEESTDREKLMSETWGRILLCVNKDKLTDVFAVLQPKQLASEVIGEVIEGDTLFCYENDNLIAQIPVDYVGLGGKAPIYDREIQEPQENLIKETLMEDIAEPDFYPKVVLEMLKSLNSVSKSYLFSMFDKSFRTDSLNFKYPSDASFVYVKEIDKTLALTIDSNSYYAEADPYIGTQIAVAEAARNIICAGGVPLAVTDCLNFGNPYDPEVFWQFTKSVEGLTDACNRFNIPVVSGNVSFYNQRSVEGRLKAISPAAVIGMLGIVESKEHHTMIPFKHKGDMIFLIGISRNDINGSEYINFYHNLKSHAAPYFDIDEEIEVQEVIKGLIRNNLVRSVHDVSSGGLFFNLLESAAPLDFGFDITSDAEVRKDAFLFGESQSRVVVSVSPEMQDEFVDFMLEKEVPFSALGHVTKGEIRIDDESYGFITKLKVKYKGRFKEWLDNV